MPETLRVEIIKAEHLPLADRLLWRAIVEANPCFASPFFRWEFTEIASRVVPHAAVAVFSRGGQTVGFFPFQKRGRLVQPLAAPMNDYHGVIAGVDESIDPATTARLLGGALRVGAWVSPREPVPGFSVHNRMAIDVGGGRDELLQRLEARGQSYFKQMRRRRRGLEREYGEPVFSFDDPAPEVLDWIIVQKREQYRRTRRHDIFACGWTADLLHQLRENRTEGFGLRISSLRTAAGGLLAAEASLDDSRTLHVWFPSYDIAFARFGTGTLLTQLQIESAAASGHRLVDFGSGDESYKAVIADVAGTVCAGVAQGPRSELGSLVGQVLARAPAPVRRFEQSLGRRFDVINACETRPGGWWTGAGGAAAAAARKTLSASG